MSLSAAILITLLVVTSPIWGAVVVELALNLFGGTLGGEA
jgi:hypothetical protein